MPCTRLLLAVLSHLSVDSVALHLPTKYPTPTHPPPPPGLLDEKLKGSLETVAWKH